MLCLVQGTGSSYINYHYKLKTMKLRTTSQSPSSFEANGLVNFLFDVEADTGLFPWSLFSEATVPTPFGIVCMLSVCDGPFAWGLSYVTKRLCLIFRLLFQVPIFLFHLFLTRSYCKPVNACIAILK